MVPAPFDTEQLLNHAAGGDQSAVSELLDRHRQRLRRMVVLRMDKRLSKRFDASDIVQDALAEAHRQLPEYLRGRPIPFYPWLRQLAWTQLLQLQRKHIQGQKRSVRRELDPGPALSDDSVMMLAKRLMGNECSPSSHVLQKEIRERVRFALFQLPAKHRDVLVMRHLEQLTIQEIAAITATAEGTVKSRLFRGISKLRSLLKDGSAEGSP